MPTEQLKEYQRKYRQKNKEQLQIYFKKYRDEHKDEIKIRNKKYRSEHLDERRSSCREYRQKTYPERMKHERENYLGTIINGEKVHIKVKKRSYPEDGMCELCGRIKSKLVYHHWDDTDPGKGVWVCTYPCHVICEAVELGLEETVATNYLKLKELVDFVKIPEPMLKVISK